MRDDLDRIYISRKGWKGLNTIEDCVYAAIQGQKEYAKIRKEILITEAKKKNNKISRGQIGKRKLLKRENSNGKENNYMDISEN